MSKILCTDVYSLKSRRFDSVKDLKCVVNKMNRDIARRGTLTFREYLDYLGMPIEGEDDPWLRLTGFDKSEGEGAGGTFVITKLPMKFMNIIDQYAVCSRTCHKLYILI